jgi:hypothetical protein
MIFSAQSMGCRSARRASAVALLSMLALARPATATPPRAESAEGSEADARSRFSEAVKLFKQGDVARALPLFEELASTTGSPNARLYVGHCHKQLERWRDAHAAFSAVVTETERLDGEKYEATRRAAQAELAALEPRVAKLVVALAEAPRALSVHVDGVEVSPKTFGSEWVLEPGSHRVEATGLDVEPISRTLVIEAGELKRISLSFTRIAQTEPHAGADSPSRRGELRTLGFVVGGVGVAGVAVWTIFGLQAKADYDALERECPDGCTNAASRDRIDHGKSSQTVANVGLAVGALGLAASGALLYLAFSEEETPRASVALSPGSASLSYEGRF